MSKIRNYFGGWYFKLQSQTQTLALIVATHKAGKEESASLQVISDNYVNVENFPIEQFHKAGKGFDVTLGANRFSTQGLHLDIHREEFDLCGDIEFGPWTGIDGDIMGPFRFVPFMECRHEVRSAYHSVNGILTLNGTEYDFTGANGYIEGDRGYSFPSVYLWTQCLFDGGSLMLSVADIPFGLFHFTGLVGFVHLNGKEYRLATYKGGKASDIKDGGCTITQGDMLFTAQLVHKNDHPLRAPVKGCMVRTIRESASCTAHYTFSIGGVKLLDLTSDKASFEYEY